MGDQKVHLAGEVAAGDRDDDENDRKVRAVDRAAAHEALDKWFEQLEREQPAFDDGEQSLFQLRGGMSGGYFQLAVEVRMEKLL